MQKTAHGQHTISSSLNYYRNATKSRDEGGGIRDEEKQESESRSQLKRKSVNVVSALSFWLLDSDSWILFFKLSRRAFP
jgi:hypothetical protein